MIDINELRDRAATFGSNYLTDEEWVEVIDRLEAAEKERDALRIELNEIRYGVAVAHDTIKTLRAKIEATEKQEPVFWYRKRSDGAYEGPIHNGSIGETRKQSGAWSPLYALPGAQPAPSVPDEAAAYSEWFHGEQGVAYDGMWAFAKAAWMARAALNSAPKPEGE